MHKSILVCFYASQCNMLGEALFCPGQLNLFAELLVKRI